MYKLMMLGACSVLLASCASMSPEECKVADWTKRGYSDALRGNTVRLLDYQQDCAKVGVVPNQQAYLNGYNNGARQFCTYENGFKAGEERGSASDICNKPELGDAFHKGLRKGKKLYKKHKEILNKEIEVSKIESTIKDVRAGKKQLSAQELDLLYREKALLNKEIDSLEDQIDDLRERYLRDNNR